MQVRSPLLQTGFTKGHRPTGLFPFMLFQRESHYVKARSLLDCLEQTDAGQFSPHRSIQHIPSHAATHGHGPNILLLHQNLKVKLSYHHVKFPWVYLSSSSSSWALFPGHPGNVWFKPKLKSGTRYCDYSLPTRCTYFINGYVYINKKIHVHVYVTTHGISLHPVSTFFLKCVLRLRPLERDPVFKQLCTIVSIF